MLASTTSPKIARSRLSTLLTLRSSFPHLTSLESMLAAATYDYLPLCLGGLSMPSGTNMSRLVCQSQERWSQRLDRIDEEVDITIFLMAEHWTHCTVDIISGLLYQQASAAPAVLCWLRNEPSAPCSAYQLARILFSLFDSAFTHHTSFDGESDYFLPHFDRLVRTVAAGKTSRESRYVSGLCVDCICCMVERLPTLRSSLWDLLRRACTSMSPDMISADMLSIGRRLSTSIGLEANSIVDHFVDTGLIWAVRHFAANNDETDEATEALAELCEFVPLICFLTLDNRFPSHPSEICSKCQKSSRRTRHSSCGAISSIGQRRTASYTDTGTKGPTKGSCPKMII